MTMPPLWLSGPAECQDFSDYCLKVLQISSAAALQAARSIQTVHEGAASSPEPGGGTASLYNCAAPPPQQHQGPGPTQLRRKGQQSKHQRGQSRDTKSLVRALFLEPAVASQNSLSNQLGPFFPLLTIKTNIKIFISPLEPTSPEIAVLQQIQDALACLYGFKAVKEAS